MSNSSALVYIRSNDKSTEIVLWVPRRGVRMILEVRIGEGFLEARSELAPKCSYKRRTSKAEKNLSESTEAGCAQSIRRLLRRPCSHIHLWSILCMLSAVLVWQPWEWTLYASSYEEAHWPRAQVPHSEIHRCLVVRATLFPGCSHAGMESQGFWEKPISRRYRLIWWPVLAWGWPSRTLPPTLPLLAFSSGQIILEPGDFPSLTSDFPISFQY